MIVRVAGRALEIEESLIINKTKREIAADISAYLRGKHVNFESYRLNLDAYTPFQRKVFEKMRRIGLGRTVSYKQLAKSVGKPRAFRAVANACGANPLPIVIPCHRVVASDGLGGYSSGIEIKKALLALESRR